MPEFRLETERLILRDWRDEDWEPFFRHTNTPAVMRWLGGLLDEERQKRMREKLLLLAEEHGHCLWAVERKPDDGDLSSELLGFCGLKRANMAGGPMGEFEVGWRLREDAWGRGYAKEAAIASVDSGFKLFGTPHIIALTIAENTASWGLMERLGMHRRPDLDFVCPDMLPDKVTIVYSLDRAEWQAARAQAA